MLLRLGAGGALEYAVFGAPLAKGAPAVVYHHGWPSSRHEAAFLHRHALEQGVSVLAVNRPGVGRSTLDARGFNFQTVADNVRQLLDHHGLRRVAFMGTSGGGPYACACACLLPERAAAVCLMAGMTQTRDAPGVLRGMALSNRLMFWAINHTPGPLGLAVGAGTALLRLAGGVGLGPVAAAARKAATDDAGEGGGGEGGGGEGDKGSADVHARAAAAAVTAPPAGPAVSGGAAQGAGAGGAVRSAAGLGLSAAATWLVLAAAGFSAADRAAVARATREQPELLALMAAGGSEVAAQGLEGLWRDMRLTSEPWGLPLGRIAAPTFIWQGDCDQNVTLAMARHLEAAIPGAAGCLRVVAGAGHIGLGLDQGGTALAEVAQVLRKEAAEG